MSKNGRIIIMKDYTHEWKDVCGIRIAYVGKRYPSTKLIPLTDLGSERVTQERLDEIRDGIQQGRILGLPTYTYWNPGATQEISTTPFPTAEYNYECGYVYFVVPIPEYNVSRALKGLRKYVSGFNDYITGQVYSFTIEERVRHTWVNRTTLEEEERDRWIELDKVGGFWGSNLYTNGMLPLIGKYLEQGYDLVFNED